MAVSIPDKYMDLLTEPVVVSFATMMPDGQPQVTPVWVGWDGEHVLVNTAKGRQKDENVRRNPKVNVMALDPENPYRYLEIRGQVETVTEEGALDHIDQLAKEYQGADSYYGGVTPAELRDKETRVIIKITPTDVHGHG